MEFYKIRAELLIQGMVNTIFWCHTKLGSLRRLLMILMETSV